MFSSLAAMHPQVVHFVVALLIVGVALRLLSLIGWPSWTASWTSPAAATLLILGTIAAVVAVKTGIDAHGPVERIPGTRSLVQEHERWGEITRNVFLGVAALELIALALRGSGLVRYVKIASAIVGIAGIAALYEASEHGGDLVYSYAGGPGLRTGDPEDVSRLLLAGLYSQSQLDRTAGRHADAAILVGEMARRWPNDTTIRLLAVESAIQDRQDPAAAIAALDSLHIPKESTRLFTRAELLRADALAASGQKESARVLLEALARANPNNRQVQDRLKKLQ